MNYISRICNPLKQRRWRMPSECCLIQPGGRIINPNAAAAVHSPSISYRNTWDMNYYDKSLLTPNGNQYRNIHADAAAAADNGLLKKRRGKPISLVVFPMDKSLTTEEELKEHNTQTSHQILAPGMILLKNHITLADQVEIVEICQEYASHPVGYFRPRKPIHPSVWTPVQTMCFGKDWDPETKYINTTTDAPPIPDKFISLVKTALQNAQALQDEHELPSMSPDTCVVNLYGLTSHLDLHQDCDESSDSLNRGLPVVSISVGDAAEFVYGHTDDVNKANKVVLESGDVLIFGGKSRHIFHGVEKITDIAPEMLLALTALIPGRLNLTFKQF